MIKMVIKKAVIWVNINKEKNMDLDNMLIAKE